MTTEQLLEEIAAGQGLSLREAARLLPSPRKGRASSHQCLLRWILKGLAAPDGQRLHLEAARLGGRGWLTSANALKRFMQAQTPDLGYQQPVERRRSLTARQRSSERAARWLEERGL
ncbi:MAG: hypothetical protein AB7K24_04000 [Gemmataceae bacterium]